MARQRSRRERSGLGREDATGSRYEPSAAAEGRSRSRRHRVATALDGGSSVEGRVPSDEEAAPPLGRRAVREVIEAIAITVAAALLFRTFVAEPFLIPTGSMAPGLMGRHVHVVCPECGRPFEAGASSENADVDPRIRAPIVEASCPDCRFPVPLDRGPASDVVSQDGDRVVVSKFFYDLFPPSRWDVIVFKFPANPKINYIKRLIGLPGEVVRLQGGDVRVATAADGPFTIARKPPAKLHAILEPVDDTAYRPVRLIERGWPEKWQPWAPAGDGPGDGSEGGFTAAARDGWTPTDATGRLWGYDLAAGETPKWLRFRQFLPVGRAWQAAIKPRAPSGTAPFEGAAAPRAELISDLSGYNNSLPANANPGFFEELADGFRSDGHHWVGDLAVEADVEVLSDAGTLLLSLVEAGRTHQAAVDVATGRVTVSLRDAGGTDGAADAEGTPPARFDGDGAAERVGPSAVRGPGRYRVRLANCDDQLTVWVDGRAVAFEGPTTFTRPAEVRPAWTEADPLDLAPAGVGGQGLTAKFDALRVFRDIYYIASEQEMAMSDYQSRDLQVDWETLVETFKSPQAWPLARVFQPGQRRAVTFTIPEGYCFPVGDNSSHSSDARFWRPFETGGDAPSGPLPAHLMIGKATCVIWPRPEHLIGRLYLVPNVGQMRRIR